MLVLKSIYECELPSGISYSVQDPRHVKTSSLCGGVNLQNNNALQQIYGYFGKLKR